MSISQEQLLLLDQEGYLVLPNFFDIRQRSDLRNRLQLLFDEEGDSAGEEFKQESGVERLANLVNKGQIFQQLICDERLLCCVRRVLGEQIKLSSANARRVPPFCEVRQPLHCDMGAVADQHGYWVCNSIWMLDDFTPDNGTIRVIPGSHRWGKLPQEELSDLVAPHADEILITGAAGTVVIMNAHLWHGGTGNRTAKSRLAFHAFYCRRDKPQQQYQRQLIDAQLQQALSPTLRHLLALDDPINDQLSTVVATRSGFLR